MLGNIYAQKITDIQPGLATAKAKGSYEVLAKNKARDDIARIMLGPTTDPKRVATRSKGLKKQVKCGLYLVEQLACTSVLA